MDVDGMIKKRNKESRKKEKISDLVPCVPCVPQDCSHVQVFDVFVYERAIDRSNVKCVLRAVLKIRKCQCHGLFTWYSSFDIYMYIFQNLGTNPHNHHLLHIC